ncbi:hypothetical protein GOODEAATRI_014901 [Goodea atripinnis]|uniref:Uncharacterized protein n=1 Tax=Goodea atripinnis TaxID=208336 RepID=A0ABV0NUM1_9TELE
MTSTRHCFHPTAPKAELQPVEPDISSTQPGGLLSAARCERWSFGTQTHAQQLPLYLQSALRSDRFLRDFIFSPSGNWKLGSADRCRRRINGRTDSVRRLAARLLAARTAELLEVFPSHFSPVLPPTGRPEHDQHGSLGVPARSPLPR